MSENRQERPLVIAGPCAAESYEILEAVAARLAGLADELGFDYYFKSSYDKANRTSVDSYRGPGREQALEWFGKLKNKYKIKVLTDIHEPSLAAPAAEVCDALQIPAFMCRQTDLIVAAVKTGRMVNIKKGQFVAPAAMQNSLGKARVTAEKAGLPLKVTLTERGASFGYGNLVVDMRSLAILAENQVPVIFDITHSTQVPATGGADCGVSGGQRCYAPLLARAAAATGYLGGFFLEAHPEPARAKCDADAQVTPEQAEALLRQLVPLWHQAREQVKLDASFK